MNNENSQTNEFLRLLMTHQKRIYAFILGMVPNQVDADDLFQETILVMWSKFEGFERDTSFSAWGIAVAKYRILNARKQFSQHSFQFSRAAQELLQKDSASFAEHIDHRLQLLQGCVRKLSQSEYDLIQMRYNQAMTIKSIAEHFDQSVQSVYKRIVRIHDRLLRCIRRTAHWEELA